MSEGTEPTTAEIAERAAEPPSGPPTAPPPEPPTVAVDPSADPPASVDQPHVHVVDGARHTADELADEQLPTLVPGPDDRAPTGVIVGTKEVVCPKCKRKWQGHDLRPHATWFCDGCQFPLFWADAVPRAVEAPGIADDPGQDALRRLPGTEGRDAPTPVTCWDPRCEAFNSTRLTCWRCGKPLTPPAPEPPPAAPAEKEYVYVPPEIVYLHQRLWPWIVATGILGLSVITLLILLILE